MEDSEISFEDFDNSIEDYNDSRHNFDVKCEPVIDILSAKIVTDDSNTTSCFKVYGSITILDSLDKKGPNKILVFDRDQHNDPLQCIYPSSETKTMRNFLYLWGPDEVPTLKKPLLHVHIRDESGHVLIRDFDLLYKTTPLMLRSTDERIPTKMHPPNSNFHQFENITTLRFQNQNQTRDCCLEVEYAAFTFGVYAEVQIFLYKDASDEKGVNVYGKICAKCNPFLMPKERYDNHMLNLIKDDHNWVGLGDKIDLFKDLVAVPAYSELEISVDLMRYEDDEFIVKGTTACFKPWNHCEKPKKIQGVNGYYVRVEVTWCKPSLLNNLSWNDDSIGGFLSLPPSHCLLPALATMPKIMASHLVEVFSLFIARPGNHEVRLYGSVKIRDSYGYSDIFTYSEKEPYFLAQGCNLLPLQMPHRAITPWISFEIDLRDIDGRVKIKGLSDSSVGTVRPLQPVWCNRPLCSVYRGASAKEKCFAVVNYTMFSYAVQAILTVRLVFKSSAHVKIYGYISASNDKLFSDPTEYDSLFFRSLLFTRNRANPLEVGEKLELSSRVAVQMTCSLLTHVDLYFQSEVMRPLVETVTFKIGESSKVIEDNFVHIRIDVEWRGSPYNAKNQIVLVDKSGIQK